MDEAQDLSHTAPPVTIPQGGSHPLKAEKQISKRVRRNIRRRLGVKHLFTMQREFITAALALDAQYSPGDLVLAAPTGSGKTLAYGVPIAELLLYYRDDEGERDSDRGDEGQDSNSQTRGSHPLRALVVVPTRDLGVQVHEVLSKLVEGIGASVGLAVGGMGRTKAQEEKDFSVGDMEVLVATPGRLVDHLKTPGRALNLRDVEYLVVDESDRLLKQAFQGWVSEVMLAIDTGPSKVVRKVLASATQTRSPKRLAGLKLIAPRVFLCGGEAKEYLGQSEGPAGKVRRFAVPETLVETTVVCETMAEKPLVLASLLGLGLDHGVNDAENVIGGTWPKAGKGTAKVVFAKSVEAAHRLGRLVEILGRVGSGGGSTDLDVVEYSAGVDAERRQQIVERLRLNDEWSGKDGEERTPVVVVCSDIMARGMDLPTVDAVVSYDVPVDVKAYLHRVGRTARGGKVGYSASIVLGDQARHFKLMQKEAIRDSLKGRKREFDSKSMSQLGSASKRLQEGLAKLRVILNQERLGLIAPDRPLAAHTLRALSSVSSPGNTDAAIFESQNDPSGGEEAVPGHKQHSLLHLQLLRNAFHASAT